MKDPFTLMAFVLVLFARGESFLIDEEDEITLSAHFNAKFISENRLLQQTGADVKMIPSPSPAPSEAR